MGGRRPGKGHQATRVPEVVVPHGNEMAIVMSASRAVSLQLEARPPIH